MMFAKLGPWKVHPQKITDANVKTRYSIIMSNHESVINDVLSLQRASLLLDQFRKKAMIYQTNNVLVPLGNHCCFLNELVINGFVSRQEMTLDSKKLKNGRINIATINSYSIT